ncbi:MAG: hypothetical protein PHW63_00350 [Alphaproteobacteria bacterium]|nr:hypothetical protein [Alphaproteobacteria bacterium]
MKETTFVTSSDIKEMSKPYTILLMSNRPTHSRLGADYCTATVNGKTVHYDMAVKGTSAFDAVRKAMEHTSGEKPPFSQIMMRPSDEIELHERKVDPIWSMPLPVFSFSGLGLPFFIKQPHVLYNKLSSTPAGEPTTVPTETPYRPGDLSGLATVAAKAYTKG